MHTTGRKSLHFLALYRLMFAARCVDEFEQAIVNSGAAFFHVSGAGHEGSAVLNQFLTPDDWLHLHYRDKALMLARGVPVEQFFHSLFCNAKSHSAGRQMSAHLSDPSLHILSISGPMGNQALQAVGVAAAIKNAPDRDSLSPSGAETPVQPIVVCSMGDGTTQQGEVMEAIAEAVRSHLPVLFWIEDNGYSISTTTRGKTFYDLPGGHDRRARRAVSEFYGLPIHRLNGRVVTECGPQIARITTSIRKTGRPAIVVFEVERLCNHTNADDETVYRNPDELSLARSKGDPVKNLREHLIRNGVSEQGLTEEEEAIRKEVRLAAENARQVEEPVPNFEAKRPFVATLQQSTVSASATTAPHSPERCTLQRNGKRLTMLEAMREVLRHRLASDPRVRLFGEDIEDPKGDVFGLTRGLSKAFPARVVNSALSESTIVGVSIGRALTGQRPVAFIQFADFLPLAFNQIACELGSMYWRTNGGWDCPVIIMIACGGYRPGLGPFHAQTHESIFAHVPGVDVLMPSTAGDAAGLLNAAFESGRPTMFFYPKNLLNDRERTMTADVENHVVEIGKARSVDLHLPVGDALPATVETTNHGRAQPTDALHLTLVTWGSCVPLCEKVVAEIHSKAGIPPAQLSVELLDLRSISPWDVDAVCESVRRTGKLLVVHEDNHTCGFGAEVVATAAQAVKPIAVRRVTRPDVFVPCHFANQLAVLPSFERILTAAAEMLGLELTWESERSARSVEAASDSLITINAIGSSPADESVTVVIWKVKPGDHVEVGQHIADVESDKAILDMTSPATGTVEEILVMTGDTVSVGVPLLTLRSSGPVAWHNTLVPKPRSISTLKRRSARRDVEPVSSGLPAPVFISSVHAVEGSDCLTNAELARRFAPRTAADIFQRTGIERRARISKNETVVTLAVAAVRKALAAEGLTLLDTDALICSTTTPLMATPSTACLILHELGTGQASHEIPAWDVNAACSGYLYALAAGYNFIQSHPTSRVLIVTAEALSTVVNPNDFDTAVLFGDAATASVLAGKDSRMASRAGYQLRRPLLSAKGEPGQALSVGALNNHFVKMDGKKVFSEAVKQMASILRRACQSANLSVQDLDMVVPHQANGRIIEAITNRLAAHPGRVFHHVREHGNTSSSSIPLALSQLNGTKLNNIGLVAFGGGFTCGAAILNRRSSRTKWDLQ